MTTSAAARSGYSSAKRSSVCAPIEAPASTARSIPRSSITRARSRDEVLVAVGVRRGRRIAAPVAARVVGDDAVPGALERLRAHDDVAVRRGQPVQQHDRDALARLARRRGPRPESYHRTHGRHRRHRAGLRAARSSSARARPPSSSTSGPSGAAPCRALGPAPREGRRRPRGQRRPRQARHRRQPAHRAGLRHPGHPRRQGVQGRPRRRRVRRRPAARAGRALLRRASCPARPTRSWPRATRRRCAARSSSSPAAPTPPSRWPACCTAAARPRRRWPLLANVSGSFAADGLAARIRLEQAEDLDLDEAFAALDDGDTERAVDLLIEALSSADGHKDDVRRVVVGALDELGVDHPLARDARRRLAAALY